MFVFSYRLKLGISKNTSTNGFLSQNGITTVNSNQPSGFSKSMLSFISSSSTPSRQDLRHKYPRISESIVIMEDEPVPSLRFDDK